MPIHQMTVRQGVPITFTVVDVPSPPLCKYTAYKADSTNGILPNISYKGATVRSIESSYGPNYDGELKRCDTFETSEITLSFNIGNAGINFLSSIGISGIEYGSAPFELSYFANSTVSNYIFSLSINDNPLQLGENIIMLYF